MTSDSLLGGDLWGLMWYEHEKRQGVKGCEKNSPNNESQELLVERSTERDSPQHRSERPGLACFHPQENCVKHRNEGSKAKRLHDQEDENATSGETRKNQEVANRNH